MVILTLARILYPPLVGEGHKLSHFEMKNKQTFKIQILILIIFQMIFGTAQASRIPASINRAAIAISAPSKIFYGENGEALSPELIADFNIIRSEEKPFDMAQVIPLNMQPSDSSSQVFSQVADKGFSSLFASERFRSSGLGRMTTEAQEKMQTEVVLGGSADENGKASTQHKLNFNVQAFQGLAQMQYSGYTEAAVKYKIAQSEVDFEISEKMGGHKNLVFSHSVSPENRLSQVSVLWVF